MENIQNLDLAVLVDMLAHHTVEYARMINEGAPDEEFNLCKTTITLLQSEIKSRKQTGGNTTITDSDINFTTDSTE